MKYAMLLFNILKALASFITTHILQWIYSKLYSILASKIGTCPGLIPIFFENLSFFNFVFWKLPFSFFGWIIVGLSGTVFSWMVSGNDTALRLSCEFQSSFLWSLASPDIRVMEGLKQKKEFYMSSPFYIVDRK